MAANQIYDDDLARSSDPPPLVPFDHVLVRAAQGSDVDYEAVVLAAGSTDTEVRVKQVGSAHTETLSRNSKRLGVGLASRRGAAVAEMQVEVFAQAFSNVFGVMLYLLMVSGQDKNLRVVRVMRVGVGMRGGGVRRPCELLLLLLLLQLMVDGIEHLEQFWERRDRHAADPLIQARAALATHGRCGRRGRRCRRRCPAASSSRRRLRATATSSGSSTSSPRATAAATRRRSRRRSRRAI